MAGDRRLNDFATALKMRDIVRKMVQHETRWLRPRYGVIQQIERDANRAEVLLNGEESPVWVVMNSTQPAEESGQIVRILGQSGDMYVDEIISGLRYHDSSHEHPPVFLDARTTADFNVTGFTLTDVTGLAVPLVANTRYAFTATILYDSTEANDFQIALTVPAASTIKWHGVGPATSATTSTAASILAPTNFGGSAASGVSVGYGGVRLAGAARVESYVRAFGTVVVGATAGNLQAQAAKIANTDATTPADDAVVFIGSAIEARTTP